MNMDRPHEADRNPLGNGHVTSSCSLWRFRLAETWAFEHPVCLPRIIDLHDKIV
jgi:hypothetical protein